MSASNSERAQSRAWECSCLPQQTDPASPDTVLAHASQHHLKRGPGALPEDTHPYLGVHAISNVCASPCPGSEEDLQSKLQAVSHHWPLCPGTLWDMFNCVVCVTQRSSFHRDSEIIDVAWHQNLKTLHCLFYIKLQYNLLYNAHKSRGF